MKDAEELLVLPRSRPLAALFSYLPNAWFFRTLEHSSMAPTGKAVCTMFACSLDHYLRLDSSLLTYLVDAAAAMESRSSCELLEALADVLSGLPCPSGTQLGPSSRLLVQILRKAARVSDNEDDKIRMGQSDDEYSVLDFMSSCFRAHGGVVSIGGAAAHMAAALSMACGEKDVTLWTAFHSQRQAVLLAGRTKFLSLHADNPEAVQAESCGCEQDPEVRNYPLEYSRGELAYRNSSGQPPLSVQVQEAGRVIVVSPGYLHYDDEGHVHRSKSAEVRPIGHLLHSAGRGSRLEEVGAHWNNWIINGLQGVKEEAQQDGIEGDLERRPAGVTVHVEISGATVTRWFKRILRKHVHSVGINIDELYPVLQNLPEKSHYLPSVGHKPGSLSMLEAFDLAALLACEIGVSRLYVHGHVLDVVIRRDSVAVEPSTSTQAMRQEVDADLYAKSTAVRWATGKEFAALRPSNVAELEELYFKRLLRPDSAGYLGLDEAEVLSEVENGVYQHHHQCGEGSTLYSVGIIPVSWMSDEPAELRTTGLGDVSSAVSFVYGYYRDQGLAARPSVA